MRASIRGTGGSVWALLIAPIALVASCADPILPALPEVVVSVDTNVQIPNGIDRLRIDLYSESGAWFASRDEAHPDPRDWPISFGVHSLNESRDTIVWVRVRGFQAPYVRTYRGERRSEWSDPFATVEGSNEPRLLQGTVDTTPSEEPSPLSTIDRLVRLRLHPGKKAFAHIVLDGSCVGTMAALDGLATGAAETCIDQEKTRVPVTDATVTDAAPTQASVSGTWLASPCGSDLPEDRLCIPGGSALIGSEDAPPSPEGILGFVDSRPVRLFGVRSFVIDRNEMTVARVREAVAGGYDGELPNTNDAALGRPTALDDPDSCTYSTNPMDREAYPVSCVSWKAAQALCRHFGGDLPTEVQWEYAATNVGRARRTRYPWGDDLGSCSLSAHSRAIPLGSSPCEDEPNGPDAVDAHPGDVTPLGVIGMGGALAEWVSDSFSNFNARCWGETSIVNPICTNGEDRSVRGGSWMSPAVWSTYRFGLPQQKRTAFVGFRCVYEVSQ